MKTGDKEKVRKYEVFAKKLQEELLKEKANNNTDGGGNTSQDYSKKLYSFHQRLSFISTFFKFHFASKCNPDTVGFAGNHSISSKLFNGIIKIRRQISFIKKLITNKIGMLKTH